MERKRAIQRKKETNIDKERKTDIEIKILEGWMTDK